MKKFLVTVVMIFVSVVALAGDKYKVKFVEIGSFDRGTQVICENGKIIYSNKVYNSRFRGYLNSLRSGDIIEVEEYNDKLLGIRKIGHEAPSILSNGGVIVDESYSGYYGGNYGNYYSGSYNNYYGYGVDANVSASFGGKHGGVSFNIPIANVVGGLVKLVRSCRTAKRNREEYVDRRDDYVVSSSDTYFDGCSSNASHTVHNFVPVVKRTSNSVSKPVSAPVVKRSSRKKVKVYDLSSPSSMF